MTQERFDLVFSGELVPGFDLQQAKQNVKALFRVDDAKLDILFSGKPIPLKKGMDADTANKYRVAMKKAGVRVAVVLNQVTGPSGGESTTSARPKDLGQSGQPAVAPSGTVAAEDSAGLSTTLGAQPSVPPQPRPEISAPDFGLAAAGTQLLNASERYQPEPVQVDISHLSVAAQQGNLLSDDELAKLPPLEITVPDLDVAPPGADMLKPDERPEQPSVALDLSGLSLAKTGERLSPAAPPAPPAPNVDHIKLA